jgi:hypothetical protein
VDDSHTRAAWAAVEQARRAVTVAWIAAVVNALVVIVALFTPFLINHLEDRAYEARYHRAKTTLMEMALFSTSDEDFDELRNLFGRNSEHWTVPESEAEYIATLVWFEAAEADQIRAEERLLRRLGEFEQEAEMSAAADEMLDVSHAIRGVGVSWRQIVRSNAEPSQAYLDEQRQILGARVRDEMIDLMLLVDLNFDADGAVKPGPMILGHCEDEQHRDICDEARRSLGAAETWVAGQP